MGLEDICSKICGALCTMVIGIVLFIGSIVGLYLNEQTAVKIWNTIGIAREKAIEIDCGPLNVSLPPNTLVHAICPISGLVETTTTPILNKVSYTMKAARMDQKTSVYVTTQSSCRDKDSRDRDTCDCTYTNTWVSLDSTGNYHVTCPSNCASCGKNPPSFDGSSGTQAGSFTSVSFGTTPYPVFELPKVFEDPSSASPHGVLASGWGLSSYPVEFSNAECTQLDRDFARTTTSPVSFSETTTKCASSTTLATSFSTSNPSVGDLRAQFSSFGKEGEVYSVMGTLSAATSALSGLRAIPRYRFTPWSPPSSSSYDISWTRHGDHTIADMCDIAESQGEARVWGLRIGLWVLSIVAGMLVGAPAYLVPEAIKHVPLCGWFFGEMLECIFCVACYTVSCLLGTAFSLLAVSIGWVAARPMVGIPLLCGFVVLMVVFIAIAVRQRAKRAQRGDTSRDTQAPYSPVNAGESWKEPQQQQQGGGWGAQQPPQGGGWGAPQAQQGYPAPPAGGNFPPPPYGGGGGGYPTSGGPGYPV
eukprot:TRINITY_DN12520_c0_g1_i1.p1 TRINITY_DN12520_c0_g1~~TRINITY_DN12520_c0_g1_i1.p1  ORF type:complete len:531 (-),score=86.35 TRINITY_DN12520_c0_g1_i1:373-1965(-)